MALAIGHPDKDEYGHFMVDGFDPIANALDGGGTITRKRKVRDLHREEPQQGCGRSASKTSRGRGRGRGKGLSRVIAKRTPRTNVKVERKVIIYTIKIFMYLFMSCNSCVTWLLYLYCQLKRDDEEGHEEEEEEVTAHDMPPLPKPTRRVSKRETDLVTQSEAVLAGREEDRQARLALERQVQQLMAERGGREDISGSNTKLYPSSTSSPDAVEDQVDTPAKHAAEEFFVK